MTRIDTMVQRVAQHHGWLENPDYDLTERVKKGLLSNHDRYGYYLCPCRDGDGDRESDKDIICPCSYAQADIDQYGQCFCGLYLHKDWQNRYLKIQSIPERRP